jgi:hypothetical protein
LQHFAGGDFERAMDLLSDLLAQEPTELLYQALRFYYLLSAGDLEGAFHGLGAMFSELGQPQWSTVDSMKEFIALGEQLSDLLLHHNRLPERSLVYAGLLSLEKWGGPA